MDKNVYNEILDMLDKAESHIHDCERWNGGDDGFKARVLIGRVMDEIRNLRNSHDSRI
nr:MAG TPA: hypothetical protein [Caudoviricetes sp.]